MQSTKIEPCREIYEYIKCIQDEHHKWAEFATGFPLSDVTHCRPSLMYYSNKKIERINDFKKLLKSIIMLKSKFNSKLYLPNQAVKFAKSFNHPVILADVQDNPGAGAASDNIEILEALILWKVESSLVGMINDPEVAKIAHKIGVGGKFRAKVGGKFNPAYPSLACNFKVISLSDGKFTFKGKMYKGIRASSGMTACLSIDNCSNIHIVISSVRCQALDKAVFTHLGLNLNNYKIIVLKSTVHFIDDFQSFSKTIINVKTDGLATCDLRDITFKNLNKNIETNL
jgi:microcystin degradation protein MlrC